MKKFTILLASVLVSAFAFASEPGEGSKGLAVVKKNETTFNLLYQPSSSASVRVAILDDGGNEVFTETIRDSEGFVRSYNFEQLNEGKYTIKVKDGSDTYSKAVDFSIKKTKSANVLKLSDNRYLVSVRGVEAIGKVTVNVYSGNKLLHKQVNEVSGDFGQVFIIKDSTDDISFEVLNANGKRIN